MSSIVDGIDYGPLAGLLGEWRGGEGMDVSPEPDGDERNPYHEVLLFEAAGDVTNAEQQTLSVVRYHQIVSRNSTGKVFHDQVGYWMWDSANDLIMQSVTIPRGITLLAAGQASMGEPVVLEVSASESGEHWGIVQSPFMTQKARTTAFNHRITVSDTELHYRETTVLDIYGRSGYQHTDENRLDRI